MTETKPQKTPSQRLAQRRTAKFNAQLGQVPYELPYLGEKLLIKVKRIGSANKAYANHMKAFNDAFRDPQTGEIDANRMPDGARDDAMRIGVVHHVLVDLQVAGDEVVPYTPEIGLEWLQDNDLLSDVLNMALGREAAEKAALKADAGN